MHEVDQPTNCVLERLLQDKAEGVVLLCVGLAGSAEVGPVGWRQWVAQLGLEVRAGCQQGICDHMAGEQQQIGISTGSQACQTCLTQHSTAQHSMVTQAVNLAAQDSLIGMSKIMLCGVGV